MFCLVVPLTQLLTNMFQQSQIDAQTSAEQWQTETDLENNQQIGWMREIQQLHSEVCISNAPKMVDMEFHACYTFQAQTYSFSLLVESCLIFCIYFIEFDKNVFLSIFIPYIYTCNYFFILIHTFFTIYVPTIHFLPLYVFQITEYRIRSETSELALLQSSNEKGIV